MGVGGEFYFVWIDVRLICSWGELTILLQMLLLSFTQTNVLLLRYELSTLILIWNLKTVTTL